MWLATRSARTLGCFLLLTGGCANQPLPRSADSAAVHLPPKPAIPVATTADLVESIARKLFGADYAGIDLVDGKLTVFKRGILPDLETTELAHVPVQSVEYSLNELEVIRSRIESNSAALRRNGVALSIVAIQPKTNTVLIEVSNDLSRAREGIEILLGPNSPVSIEEEPNPIRHDMITLVPTSVSDEKEPH